MKIKTTFFEKNRIKPAIRNLMMGLCLSTGLFANAQTPVAYYPFNGDANDAVGSNNGTVNGATLTTDRFGNANSAYSFSGTSRIEVPDAPALRPTDVTLSGWFYHASTPGTQIIASKNLAGTTHETYAIFFYNGNIAAAWGNAGAVELLTGPIASNSQWHQIAFTFNDATNTAKLYLDGGEVNSVATNLSLGYDNSTFSIGSELENSAYSFFFNGSIDGVKIYNTALTAAQVLASFNSPDADINEYRSIASGDWSSPSIWEVFDGTSFVPAATAPSSADGVITIRNEHNVTVNSPVTVDQVVIDAGGTLTQNAAITLNDGTGNDLSVGGTWIWNGNSLVGTGDVIIASGGLLNIATGGEKTLGVPIFSNGTIDWQDGLFRSSVAGLIFINNGLFTISGNNGTDQVNGTGNLTFINNGTLTKTSSGGTGLNHFSLNNPGILNINAGTLVFANGTINNSSPIILSNATLAVNEGLTFNWNTGSAITGSGVLSFNHPGSTLVLNNDMVIPSTISLVLASNVTGAGNLTCNGALTLNSYYIEINGPGTLEINENSTWNAARLNRVTTVANGKTLTMANGSDKWLGANLINNGTIDWQDGSFRFTAAGVTCTNAGLFTISGNNGTDQINGTGNLNFINSGTLKKTSTGTTSFNHFSCTNNGTIQGLGTYNFMSNPITGNGSIAPGLSPGILTMDGQQPLSANSTLEIEILDGTGAGTGHDQLQRNGDLTLAGTLTVIETGIVPEGTYTIVNLTSGNISGNFTSFSLPPFYSVQVNASDVKLIKMYPRFDLTLFLEGPFNGTTMNADLNVSGLLPLSQPYNAAPWNYTGTESVGSIPNANVVDWVLVEFRDATTAASATAATTIARQTAFILSDGSITDLDGSSNLFLNIPITNNLYVVVWHKNHLGVMSADPLTLSGGNYAFDFTTASAQAYGGSDGHKELASGKWGMFSGDGDANNTINPADKAVVWAPDAGLNGYLNADFSRNGQVNNPDKNDLWQPNLNKVCQIP